VLKTLVRRRTFGKLQFSLSPIELPLVILIVTLLLYVALAMAFHPMFLEYDAAYDYLPFAKGLSVAGGFYPNPFVASNLHLTEMPLMPFFTLGASPFLVQRVLGLFLSLSSYWCCLLFTRFLKNSFQTKK
jgi:hypothetical protein